MDSDYLFSTPERATLAADERGEDFYAYVAQTWEHAQAFPIKGATQVHLTDQSDNRYLDFTSGISVMNLGLRPSEVIAAIKEQLDVYTHTMIYGEHMHDSQIRYAKALSQRFPPGPNGSPQQVFFVNSGTEAIDLALKISRRVSGKKPMVALENGFHGRGYGSMAVSWRDEYKSGFFVDDSTTFLDPNVSPGRWADPQNWAQFGGFVLELVQGEAGCIPLDVEWVRSVVAAAQSANVPVMIDEIQTGYGRTGTFSAQEQYGIHPDITCLGKAGGGGLPFGAVVSSVENFRALQTPPLSHISTFGGNAVVMAAGCAVMDSMTDELFTHVQRMGDLLRNRIGELAERYPSIISGVRGRGLMNGLLLANSELSAPFHQACKQRGLMLFFKLNAGNVLRMSPALIISSEQINEAVTIMEQACQDLSRRT